MRGKSFIILSIVLIFGTAWLIAANRKYASAPSPSSKNLHNIRHAPYPSTLAIQPFCPLKKLIGIPCPGCGSTRAILYLSKGRFREALYMNPLALLVALFCAIAYFWAFADLLKNRNTLEIFLTTPLSPKYLPLLLIPILLNWIFNFYKGF